MLLLSFGPRTAASDMAGVTWKRKLLAPRGGTATEGAEVPLQGMDVCDSRLQLLLVTIIALHVLLWRRHLKQRVMLPAANVSGKTIQCDRFCTPVFRQW